MAAAALCAGRCGQHGIAAALMAAPAATGSPGDDPASGDGEGESDINSAHEAGEQAPDSRGADSAESAEPTPGADAYADDGDTETAPPEAPRRCDGLDRAAHRNVDLLGPDYPVSGHRARDGSRR